MEHIIDCYVKTSIVALNAVKCKDPNSWDELHTLLPNLREQILCRLCRKLVDHVIPVAEGFACSECVGYQNAEDSLFEVIQCYKKMCQVIYTSPIYNVMCSRPEDMVLVELITEAIGVPRPKNGHIDLPNGSIPSTVVKQGTKEANNHNNIDSNSSLDVELPNENNTSTEFAIPQVLSVQSLPRRSRNQSVANSGSKKKKNERQGCRCGKASSNRSNLTCFGQRCPCYIEEKPCDLCKCRGCRNPRQKQSNNDDNLESDQMRRKPVTLELVSSLQPSNINNKTASGSYTMRDVMQLPSNSQNYEQGGTEDTLAHINSTFRSS